MAKVDLLRVQDVRDAYRLIGECRDLGGDPSLWQMRMFEGLSHQFGTASTGGEGRLAGPKGGILPLTYFDFGFDAADKRNYLTYMREGGAAADPFVRALQRRPGGVVTRIRSQILEDRVYYRSPVFER